MNYAKCQYCGKLNQAKKMAVKKNCDVCYVYGRKMGAKKGLSREQRIKIVNWLVSQKQECVECKSKEKLTIDRIIPERLGGKYEIGNIQILCHRCNTQIKIGYSSIKDAKKTHTHKICSLCNKRLPLNSKNFQRTNYIAKYRSNSISNWHTECKKCRSITSRIFDIKCSNCKLWKKASKPTQKTCSYICAGQLKASKAIDIRKCLSCGESIHTTKGSKRKYCNNTCSAKNMVITNKGFIRSKLKDKK